jgi:signal transduction histidine kinase
MGLFIMRERVDLVRGQLEIISQATDGTQIRAAVPLASRVVS